MAKGRQAVIKQRRKRARRRPTPTRLPAFTPDAGTDRQGVRHQTVAAVMALFRCRIHIVVRHAERCARRRRRDAISSGSAATRSPPSWPHIGAEPFRARQLWHWIYHRGATDFAPDDLAVEGISRPSRRALRICAGRRSRAASPRSTERANGCCALPTGRRPRPSTSPRKIAARCASPRRSAARSTAPSAIPARSCWCAISGPRRSSGKSWSRATRSASGRRRQGGDDRQLTNIVLMGMGEPLYNFDNVAAAIKIVMDPEGLSISRRKITLSTAGVVPMIRRCGAELGGQPGDLAACGARRAA